MAIRFTNMFGNCPSGCLDRQHDQCAPAALCNICKNTGPEGSFNFNPNCWMRVDGKLVPKYEMDARRNVPVAAAGAGRLPMGVTESIRTARHSLPFRNADGITPFGVYSDNFGMPSGAVYRNAVGVRQTQQTVPSSEQVAGIGYCKKCYRKGYQCCPDMTKGNKFVCCGAPVDPSKTRLRNWYDKWIGQ